MTEPALGAIARVVVSAGNLLDSNKVEVQDDRTTAELLNLYAAMTATTSTAQISVNATIASYEAVRTQGISHLLALSQEPSRRRRDV